MCKRPSETSHRSVKWNSTSAHRARLKPVHRVVFGDCKTMKEIPDGTIRLMVTSPPYYNAPFDYPRPLRDIRGVPPTCSRSVQRSVSCDGPWAGSMLRH